MPAESPISLRTIATAVLIAVLLFAAAALAAAFSAPDAVSFALGTAGVPVLVWAVWPRGQARGRAFAVSWLLTLATVLGLLWLDLFGVLHADPRTLLSLVAGVMLLSLLPFRGRTPAS